MTAQISVVVLCYKASDSIRGFAQKVIDHLNQVTENWELVLVANHFGEDDDDTPTIVRELAASEPRIKTVTRLKEGMMGWDARCGLGMCTGEIVALIDGDGQMDAGDIGKAYEIICREGCDMVTTYREKRFDSLFRNVQSSVYNLLFKILFPGLGIRDVNSKPKMMRREAFDKLELRSDDWFLDAEIMIQARRHRFKIIQMPTVFREILERRSFVKLSAVFEFLLNFAKTRMSEFFR